MFDLKQKDNISQESHKKQSSPSHDQPQQSKHSIGFKQVKAPHSLEQLLESKSNGLKNLKGDLDMVRRLSPSSKQLKLNFHSKGKLG